MPKRVDFSRADFPTIIASEETLSGSITSKHNILIQGGFKGPITSKGLVKIDEGAKVIGDIEANDVQVLGVVEGNITIRNMLDLGPLGEIKGRFRTKMMWAPQGFVLKEGCVVEKKDFPMFY
jgi:cytoskeletal protein CcmA (bactofilin family)